MNTLPAPPFDNRGTSYRPNKSAGYSPQRRPRNSSQRVQFRPNQNGPQLPPPDKAPPPNADPQKLIELLKTSGEYDRLRKEVFSRFQNSDMRQVLLSRVDGVANEYLGGDPDLLSKSPETVHAEVMQEVDRYPFVGRQVLCVPIWREEEWLAGIESTISNLLHGRPANAPPMFGPPLPVPPVVQVPPKDFAPWRMLETPGPPVPEVPDQGLGEDDMAIDDD